MQIRAFARFAQIYAVRVSDFVRQNNLPVLRLLFLVSRSNPPEAARIVFDCRAANEPPMMSLAYCKKTARAMSYTDRAEALPCRA